jgi:GDP-mannose 6-dehydrogenase
VTQTAFRRRSGYRKTIQNMNISVFGLGYVGSVSIGCLAALGHRVTGVDVNPTKVDLINAGRSPVVEADLGDLIQQGVKDGRIHATTQATEAVLASDLSLVCVGTPSSSNGDLNLEFVDRVCRDIGGALKSKSGFHMVVLRSTMLPGTTEEKIIPALEAASGKKAGRDFGVSFNPEFLREGTAVHDFHHPPFTLIGEHLGQGAEIASGVYQGVNAPLLVVPLKVAEMIKYVSNAFHALKIAFANEIGNICKQYEIDSHLVMDIFCKDEKLNISPYYLKPGFAFGGSCLPKDVRALLYQAHRKDLMVPVLEAILPSNDNQIRQGLRLIKQTGYKKVGVLGFSFKAGTDDLRESPLVELIEILIGKGYEVKVFDENVNLARLQGANRAYIEREIPHIATLMCKSMEELLAGSQVIVIGNKAPEFTSIPQRTRPDQVIIDLVRVAKDLKPSVARYQGICW